MRRSLRRTGWKWIGLTAAVGLWLFCYQPKIFPLIEVDRLQQFARAFDPVKADNHKDGINCKFGADINLDFPTKLTVAFRTMDAEYKKAIILIFLKAYRCQIEAGNRLGWPMYEMFEFDSLDAAFLRVVKDVPQNEYKSVSLAFEWVEGLEKNELGDLADETRKICQLLRPWESEYKYQKTCKKHFPEI